MERRSRVAGTCSRPRPDRNRRGAGSVEPKVPRLAGEALVGGAVGGEDVGDGVPALEGGANPAGAQEGVEPGALSRPLELRLEAEGSPDPMTDQDSPSSVETRMSTPPNTGPRAV